MKCRGLCLVGTPGSGDTQDCRDAAPRLAFLPTGCHRRNPDLTRSLPKPRLLTLPQPRLSKGRGKGCDK